MPVEPSPGSTDLVLGRLKRIKATRDALAANPPADEAGQVAQQKLIAQLDAAQAQLNDELACRNRYRQLTAESKLDQEPSFLNIFAHRDWKKREEARRMRRKALQARISAHRQSRTPIFPAHPAGSATHPCPFATSPKQDPVKPINRIVAVEILDGTRSDGVTDDRIVGGRGVQWVNLEDYALIYFDEDLPDFLKAKIGKHEVTSFDRLGRLVRLRVRFLLPQVDEFQVIVSRTSQKNTWSSEEKSRPFGYTPKPAKADGEPEWSSYRSTNDQGIGMSTDCSLTAGGLDEFKFEARDLYGNQVTTAGSLVTMRGLFLVTMKMDNPHVTPPALDTLIAEYDRNGVQIQPLTLEQHGAAALLDDEPILNSSDDIAAVAAMPRQSSGSQWADGVSMPSGYAACPAIPAVARFDEDGPVRANALTVFSALKTDYGRSLRDLKPYLVAMLFVDMCTDEPEPTIINLPPRQVGADGKVEVNFGQFLWDTRDADHPWFLSGEALYVEDGGGRRYHELSDADFDLIGSARAGWRKATVNLPEACRNRKVAFRLWVRVPGSSLNGFSRGRQGGWSLIAICARNVHKPRTDSSLQGTEIHELGHKINMTIGPIPPAPRIPRGQRITAQQSEQLNNHAAAITRYRGLDKTPNHYLLAGDHCYTGAQPTQVGGKTNYSGLEGQCVMYGEGWSGRPKKFCGECSQRVLRIDLSEGWKDWS